MYFISVFGIPVFILLLFNNITSYRNIYLIELFRSESLVKYYFKEIYTKVERLLESGSWQ